MLSRIARFALRLHILKKAASLQMPARLRYLSLARRVHGVMIPFCALLALGSALLAAVSLFPELEVALHWAERVYPEDRVIGLCIGAVFLIFTGFSVLMLPVLLRTREMLAAAFIANLIAYTSWCSKVAKTC